MHSFSLKSGQIRSLTTESNLLFAVSVFFMFFFSFFFPVSIKILTHSFMLHFRLNISHFLPSTKLKSLESTAGKAPHCCSNPLTSTCSYYVVEVRNVREILLLLSSNLQHTHSALPFLWVKEAPVRVGTLIFLH